MEQMDPMTIATPAGVSEAPTSSGFVRYQNVGSEYLEQRTLKKSAGWISLWALGVGVVISGEFFGWNFGLAAGGFWGLSIATALMAIMYVCMVYCISELTAALPHAGGFYSFTRCAFGPLGGFICGVTDTIEYVLTVSVTVVAVAGYLQPLLPGVPLSVWWIACYAIFLGINIVGVELTMRAQLLMTVMAMVVLVVFYVACIQKGTFNPALLFNVAADPGQSTHGLPKGVFGIFAAFPFAIWWYLAIESLPLAAEETHDVVRDVPKALITGIFTLLALSLFVLILNSGVGGGADAMGKSAAPMSDALLAVFGAGPLTTFLVVLALAGLLTTIHGSIYAYGRVIFALSRAGYFPRVLSITGKRKTPWAALLAGGAVGLAAVFLIDSFGSTSKLGAALLNMAVFGAVISYSMVMVSYIKLKITRKDLPRPYKSPLGIPGAAVGALLAVVALGACFANPDFRPAVWATALFLALAVMYFIVYSRTRLVAQAPEERIALAAAATITTTT
ncbi:MAG TPA: amino acid permease [Polyangiaceae bacterium]|jgi:ethanolamine permease|nr:amino acid permease [Polyangiaceae bacterium]